LANSYIELVRAILFFLSVIFDTEEKLLDALSAVNMEP